MKTLGLLIAGCFIVAAPGIYALDAADVISVYDGDTITVEFEFGNEARVRLIGIDAPEMAGNVHGPASKYGPESRDYLAGLVGGKTVELEYDVEQYDKYTRLLAYVFIPGGSMVNEQMLKDGYALLYTVPPNVKYVEGFTAAQREARSANKGLWAVGGFAKKKEPERKVKSKAPATKRTTGRTVYITRTGSKYHRAGCRYLRKSCIPISLKDAIADGYSP